MPHAGPAGPKAFRPALLVGLLLCLAGVAGAYDVYMPTVPDPSAMIIDGSEADWGWYDRSFAVNPDMIASWSGQYAGSTPPAEDFAATYFVAWSPPPENKFYLFARVFDDTLRDAEGANRQNWWNDDVIQISIDADHSGGNYLGQTIEELGNGQRLEMKPGYPPPANVSGFEAGAEWRQWMAENPDYIDVATTLLPPDATNMSRNVEYTYEFRMALWDYYGPSAAESLRHVFAPDQVVGLSIRFDDGDGGANGQQSLFGIQGGDPLGDRDGDKAGHYIALLTAEPTAVESATWARIKSHLTQLD
jgi:hypothetical protein